MQVRADMSEAVQKIGALNEKIVELKTSQKELQAALDEARVNGVDAQGRSVAELSREIAANTEAQKAYKKEIGEVSRQVQNTIISENTYKDTLKGMAAQLSVEKDELRQIKIAGGELTDEYKRQQEIVNTLNTKVSTLEQAYGVYTRNVGNYKSGVQELNEMLRQHLQKLGQLPEGSKEWEKEAQAVKDCTKQLDDLNKEQAKVENDQQGFFAKAKNNWVALAGWIGAAIAAIRGLYNAIKGIIKTNIEFEQAQKNLQTILGLNNKEMAVMSDKAKELGKTTEYTASQVTDLQTALAKLGFSADDINNMSESVLALATDLDAGLGEAAELAGSVLRQFGLDASDTEHVVDVLVKGANESALSFDKYRTALSQVAPVASAVGFDLEGVVSILGSLANVGMDASMAANSTRNILLKLADANSDLAQSLSQPVKDIPTLVAGLKELQDRNIDVATALELTDKRSVAAFTSLLKNADAVQELNDKLANVDGYAIGIREERLQTVEGSIKLLQSAWEGFELAVMNSEGPLSRFFRKLADDINELTDAIEQNGKTEFQKNVEKFTKEDIEVFTLITQDAQEQGGDARADVKEYYDNQMQYFQDAANALQAEIDDAQSQIDEGVSKRDKKRLEKVIADNTHEIDIYRAKYQALKATYEQYEAEMEALKKQGEDTGGEGGEEQIDKKEAYRRLENRKKMDAAIMAYQKAYEYDSAKSAEENEELKYQHEKDWKQREFELNQSYEREKLRLQQQYGDITAQDLADGLAILEQESKNYYANVEREQTERVRKMMLTMTDAMLKTDPTKAAIKKVEDEYRQLYANLDTMVKAGELTQEEATYYYIGLKQKESEEVAKIEKDARDKRAKDEEQALNEQMRKRQEQLKTDLQLAWDNANEQYRIRKQYIEQELQLAGLSAARRAELEQQLTELMKSENEKRMDAVMEYVSQVSELFTSFNQISNNQSQERTQRYEQENEQEKAALDKRLKAGLMSQRQYDDKVAKLDKELADKKAEETRKQAEREKALAVFQIAINTAQAVMKIWAEVPKMDFGVSTAALTAVAIGLGAVQAAAVMSQPLPKARRGGRVEGASHEQGGVLIETEGEERIIASNPSKAFPELLNLISYIGKQSGAMPDTGYALRHGDMATQGGAAHTNQPEIDYDLLADKIGDRVVEGVKDLQIWLSLAELRDAEAQQVHIESLAKQ